MEAIKKIIAERKPQGIRDYFPIDKRIENEKAMRKPKAEKAIKIAILSSFTTQGMKEVLNVKCCGLEVMPEFYTAAHSQYAQDIINKEGPLYKFSPDLVIFFIDTMSLFGEAFFFPYRLSDQERKRLTEEKYNEVTALVKALTENMPGKIILHNFEVPTYSPLGILENKQKFGFFEMVRTLNDRLQEGFKNNNRVFIFDYDLFCSKHGKKRICDSKMYYLGDIKLDFGYMPFLCEEYMGFIKPLMSLTKKCIVLDLDNTLWGGIVGEDGLDGIKLGPTPEGRPFWELQKHILNLSDRGIILAINSSNNPDDALRVLREHPYMILKEEHFASIKIDWTDKVTKMKEIARELNIGLESMVFIDDDKVNAEVVRKALPEINVIDLPDDPALYVETLAEVNEFNALRVTEEDAKRGRMYASERKRRRLHSTFTDISEFLRTLDVKVTIVEANSFTIPRVSQLTQKTNQFNMTTKRYREEDIKNFAESNKFTVLSAKVEDKFGDNGIAGMAIVEKDEKKWCIDTFLLSCRVIGRRIEETLIARIVDEAQKEKVQTLIGHFIPTKKNAPARDFYKNSGFKLINEIDDLQIWEFDVAKGFAYPDFIRVARED